MILRFRSKSGMVRVATELSTPFPDALQEACAKFGLLAAEVTVADSPSATGTPLATLNSKTVADLNLKNGDIVYVSSGAAAPGATQVQSTHTAVATETASAAELPVDLALQTQDGLIPRGHSNLCRHGDKGMCEYCSPLPPWDRDYLDKHGIKHKSFHAHVREANQQQNNPSSGSSYIAPLLPPSYTIKANCASGHAPYPKGICSKCQPAPITLQQQKFRMVDHLEYADHLILNRFIDTWRQTGLQRYGVLYGRYEQYDKVPLGIKAVVEAIYEPPQASELDGVTLLEWKNQETVDAVARELGLYQVGAVFTDLTDSGNRDGTVLCKRHKDSFFLSCVEAIMAARNQSAHPNATHFSDTKQYSSKYVTCVITGGLQGEIEPRAYQVSASAQALVAADDISASTHPNMIHVKETSGSRYVPDVFYSKINEYGLEVKENAKPAFPVDFLLVTLLDSFPVSPTPMFIEEFPVESREFLGELQNMSAVRRQLQGGSGDSSRLADFHFLVHVATMDVLSDDEMRLLLRFVKNKDPEDYVRLIETGGWMTLLTILEQSV